MMIALGVLLVSSQLCYGKVGFHTSIGSMELAFGKHHVSDSLRSKDLIVEALDHHRVQDSQLQDSSLRNHILCGSYADLDLLRSNLLSVEAKHTAVSYSSSKDDIGCYYTTINAHQRNRIKQMDFPLKLLVPIPNLLKLDSSISSYQTMITLKHSRQSSSLPGHPILNKVSKGKPLELTVMFRHGSDKNSQEVSRQTLLAQVQNPTDSHVTLVFESSFWLHELSNKESRRSLKFLDKELIVDRDTKRKARKEHVERTFHEDSSEVGRAFHAQRKAEWTHYHTLLKDANIAEVCGFHKLIPNPHSNGFSFRLPEELIHTESSAHPDMTAACFNFLVTSLSLSDEVVRIALTLPMHTMNNNARQILQSGTKSGAEPFSAVGLNGTGIVIGVSDTGIDEDHCFFRDPINGKVPRADVLNTVIDHKYRKVIQYVNFSGSSGDFASGHGSHVAGTLAGYCVTEGDQNDVKNVYMGMASGAKLAFFDIGVNDAAMDLELPYELSQYLFPPAYQAGARIHSNSWGGGYFFDGYCIETDKYLYENDDFAVLFAAGNDGGNMETIVSPSLAKNAISVGCSENAHSQYQAITNIAYFSSIGPTHDGRYKPDIVAPGFSIYSTKAASENKPEETCGTEAKAGTSMATPAAAGNAALIQQYFEDPRFWAHYCDAQYPAICKAMSPSGYLLKALLIHSADAMSQYNARGTTVGLVHLDATPDTYQGYGRVDLSNILPLAGSKFKLYFDQSTALPQLTQMTYTVTVTDSTVPLRVTLSWYDPPNDVFAAKTLLHDLDLILIDPSGKTFYGNGRNSGGLPAYGSHRDEVNNNEQVIITTPTTGDWTVHVQAKRLTEAPTQKYAVVMSCKGTFSQAAAPVAISSLLIQDCVSGGGTPYFTPRLEVDVSLWSRVDNDGWNSSDSYSISSVGSSGTSPIYSGTLSDYSYGLDTQCMPTGCYAASLALSSSSKRGTQMSIAQCGVFLSATNPAASFCVNNPVTLANTTTQYYAEDACFDPCTRANHYELELLLGEEQGAGWNGAYYTVQKIPSTADSTLTFASQSVAGGSMEWDFEEYPSKCLPEAPACYAVQLSVPSGTEDIPQMYLMNTYVDETKAMICPIIMDSTITLAKFCTAAGSDLSTVTYYRQTAPADLGQTPSTTWSQFYLAVTTGLTAVGTCVMDMPLQISSTNSTGGFGFPTMMPSPEVSLPEGEVTPDDDFDIGKNVTDDNSTGGIRDDDQRPTLLPTAVPTTVHLPSAVHTGAPTQSKGSVYGGYNFDCLKDCVGYSTSYFGEDQGATCFFLGVIYDRCSSFSVAYGLCTIPQCASDCSVEDWCYFAAGTVTSCPYNDWQGATTAASEISTQCVSSINAANHVDSHDDTNADEGFHLDTTTLVLIILVAVVIGIVVVVCLFQYAFKPSDRAYSMTADQSTHHGGSFPRGGSGNPTSSGPGGPSLLRSSGNFIKSIVDKTGGKSRRASTGKKGVYEMVPGSGNAGKTPFSIIGEDDEEEEVNQGGVAAEEETGGGHQEDGF